MSALVLDRGPLLLPLRRQNCRRLECLRIGVVVEDQSVPLWEKELIEWLAGIEGLEVTGIGATGRVSPSGPVSRVFDFILRHSSRRYNPFEEAPLPTVVARAGGSRETSVGLDLSRFAELGKSSFDLVLWLSPNRKFDGALPTLAKFGVISFELGRSQSIPPYFDETARGDPLSSVTVYWQLQDFERTRKLRTAQLPTDQGVAFTCNARQPLVALAQMAATICLEILEEGEDWLQRALQLPEQRLVPVSPQAPSGLTAIGFVLRKAFRSVGRRLRHRGRDLGWFVALRRNDSRSYFQSGRFSAEGLRDLPLAPGSRMADPFLVDYQGRTFLYFEEVPPGRSAGRLSCSEVRDDGSISDATLILEDERNLSYPCVFLHQGEYFMIPERGERRRVSLFRATRMPYEFKLETTYIEDVALADTTPLLIDGTWYFFTTTYEPFMQTLLFWTDRLNGQWRLHPKSPVSCSAANSRGAGAIKRVRGRLLRPTQDCSLSYGYAMVINEIVRINRTEFEERPIDRLLPTWRKGLLGTHTWNTSSKFEVFDGCRHLL